jgi:hypothetical protein
MTKSLAADSHEIVKPFVLSEEATGPIRSELSIGELILPLYVEGLLPEPVLPSDFYSYALPHKLLPLAGPKLYQAGSVVKHRALGRPARLSKTS